MVYIAALAYCIMYNLPDIIAKKTVAVLPYNTARAHDMLDMKGMAEVRIAVQCRSKWRSVWVPYAYVTFDVRTHEGIEYLKQYVLNLQTELDRLKIDSPTMSTE